MDIDLGVLIIKTLASGISLIIGTAAVFAVHAINMRRRWQRSLRAVPP